MKVFDFSIKIDTISAMHDDSKILVGKIVAPQGLKGELRVQTYTSSPEDLKKLKIQDSEIKFVRAIGKNIAVCKVDEVDDRNGAEKLLGTELFINRSDLPKLKEGEHYITDLIGMTVIMSKKNDSSARVVYIHNFGAGDILELDNGEMISFNGAIVDYVKREIRYE